jgi:hypothetical protein
MTLHFVVLKSRDACDRVGDVNAYASNAFMTFAWYAHIKTMSGRAWSVKALMSWDVALFEYRLQVPANRIGSSELPLPQLKILQEMMSLSVFVPFAVFYMR